MSHTFRNHSWSKRWFAGIKESALGRDKKPGSKPPGWYKRLRRRLRRHREKQAMRNGQMIPIFKKDDQWNWT